MRISDWSSDVCSSDLRGSQAPAELAQLLDPQLGQRLLNLGCGIGGPARWLARERGCEVVGLDLTETFCRTARDASAGGGLGASTRFLCAEALRSEERRVGEEWGSTG